MKHTKGPWEIKDHYATIVLITDEGGQAIGEVYLSRPTEEERANANLIAAAPSMYAALDAIAHGSYSCIDDLRFARSIAEKALAKAMGEA